MKGGVSLEASSTRRGGQQSIGDGVHVVIVKGQKLPDVLWVTHITETEALNGVGKLSVLTDVDFCDGEAKLGRYAPHLCRAKPNG